MTTINPTTPAAIISPAATPTLVDAWRADRAHSDLEHAVYALARVLHWQDGAEEEKRLSDEDFIDHALKKLVRTFSPIRSPNKLSNGHRQFGALFGKLSVAKEISQSYSFLPITNEDRVRIMQLAADVFKRARAIGPAALLALAQTPPSAKEKKPYVRG